MTASPLYMLRFDPDIERMSRWAKAESVLPRIDDGGYGWHALIKAAFGPNSPQPFRIVERSNRPPYLLAYSARDEASLRAHAALAADPAVSAALGLETLAIKRMPVDFEDGQRLGFEVRVRPTIRQDRDGDRTRSRERDAFLAAVDHAGPREARAEIDRTTVYRDWLHARFAAGGATLVEARILTQRRTLLARRDRSRNLEIVGSKGGGPDVTFAGTLSVRDPALFRQMLARGVGRHRAFGFGMLLLKPPTVPTA